VSLIFTTPPSSPGDFKSSARCYIDEVLHFLFFSSFALHRWAQTLLTVPCFRTFSSPPPPYLGARNTFYGNAKQKVGVRVHDFFSLRFLDLNEIVSQILYIITIFCMTRIFFNSTKLSLACSNVIFVVDTFQ
jgi:hypothetical protein